MTGKRPKLLRFPYGCQINSERIHRVHVYPDISPAITTPYVRVFDRMGLVYEGVVDLDAIEVT